MILRRLPRSQTLRRFVDGWLRLVALALLTSMTVAALHDVSQAYDVWYYHWPFAARLLGIVPRSEFIFSAGNEARYGGFPLLGEFLQGLLWRVTGLPTAANLVALGSVPLIAIFLRRYKVPVAATVIALLAIPLVQTHATSCYVDLPANSAASILVLVTLDAYERRECPPKSSLALALLGAAVAANMKTLLQPMALVFLILFCARYLAKRGSGRRLTASLVLLAVVPVVFATPLKNELIHENPFYPVQFSAAGHTFAGPEAPYASSPHWLSESSRPVRFAASVLEIGLRPMTDRRRWTVDQWTPPDAAGYRMGGFFGGNVLLQLALLVLSLIHDRSRSTVVAISGFVGLTAVVAIMPQSHELRYYMLWMIVLVCINLRSAARAGKWAVSIVGALSCVALAAVLLVTRGGYVYTSGMTFDQLLHARTDETYLARVPRHATVCVAKEPFNLLWASRFHPGSQYVLKEAERPEDCEIR